MRMSFGVSDTGYIVDIVIVLLLSLSDPRKERLGAEKRLQSRQICRRDRLIFISPTKLNNKPTCQHSKDWESKVQCTVTHEN